MNLKTTIFLLLLSGGCVGLYYKGRALAPRVGVAVPETMAPAESNAVLGKIKPDDIRSIVILHGKDRVELKADKAGQPLQLVGNWPTRGNEVDELKNLLGHLQSRFAPIPATDDIQWADYGLADSTHPTIIVVETVSGGKPVSTTMTFGALAPSAFPAYTSTR